MKHILSIGLSINIVITVCTLTFGIPKTMAVDLYDVKSNMYTSEVFHLPVYVSDAKLDISLLMSTYLRAILEFRAGDNYVQLHLSDLSLSGHFEFDILELFTTVTSRDVSLTLNVDTDGIIQGVPQVSITYYGFW